VPASAEKYLLESDFAWSTPTPQMAESSSESRAAAPGASTIEESIARTL